MGRTELEARECETHMAKQANQRIDVEASSGNVFADLGLRNAAELDTKVRLAVKINGLFAAQRLNPVRAAVRLKLTQPELTALKNYRLSGFPAERLMSFLLALGQYAG